MNIIFSDKLLKSIPKEQYSIVLQDINNFYKEYVQSNFNIRNMKNGWSIRNIKGSTNIKEIYKFRVNIKDRVLFTYGKYLNLREEFYNSIVFLEFCSHDKQAIRGRGITPNQYSEEKFEDDIDELHCNYVYDISKCISRVVTTEELVEMLEGRDDRATYYLNDTQMNLINEDIKPLFIFGSAGSGKTTISISKAFILFANNIKVGYFTYSDNLVEEAKNIFEKILKDNGDKEYLKESKENISFNCVNTYLKHKAKKTSLVTYEEFKLWAENIMEKNLKIKGGNIEILDIYREIRGIIKGIVPLEWLNIYIEKDNLHESFLEYLIENKFAYLMENKIEIDNRKLAELNTNINNRIKDYKIEFKEGLELIYQNIEENIIANKLISEELYMKLPKKYSIFNNEDKEVIYNIAQKYQHYLESNCKLDENDLTRIVLKEALNNNLSKFDYIICDEIQDLSEIQIFLLLKLVSNIENILFCGDYNQTINPTFFDSGRVEAIFKVYNGLINFKDRFVETNYRSSKEIVDFANQLTKLKKEKIGKNKNHDYYEIAIRRSSNKIKLLNINKENQIKKDELLSLLKQRAYVDILVADEIEKGDLIKDSKDNKLVFTVANYKGLENEYIIGYNIITKFKHKWKEILSKDFNSNINQLRYYFNFLYVFITRARNNILLIEEDISKELLAYFKEHIEIVDKFDYKKLNLIAISSNDEHYKKATRLEKNKRFEEAIEAYKNSDLEPIQLNIEIKRCELLLKMEQGYYKEASKGLVSIGEYKYAIKAYLAMEDYLNVVYVSILNNCNYEEIRAILSPMDVDPMHLVNSNYNKISWKHKFEEVYHAYMKNKLYTMTNDINEIEVELNNVTRIV